MEFVRREILIQKNNGVTGAAIIEDGRVREILLASDICRWRAGNIYRGRVTGWVSDGAHVDIAEPVTGLVRSPDFSRETERVLVQRLPARHSAGVIPLTTRITLTGYAVIYQPHEIFVEVNVLVGGEGKEIPSSRLVRGFGFRPEGNFTFRTENRAWKKSALQREVRFLHGIWKKIEAKAQKADEPELIYEEGELEWIVVRDYLTDEVQTVVIDDYDQFRLMQRYAKTLIGSRTAARLKLHEGPPSLFESRGIPV